MQIVFWDVAVAIREGYSKKEKKKTATIFNYGLNTSI